MTTCDGCGGKFTRFYNVHEWVGVRTHKRRYCDECYEAKVRREAKGEKGVTKLA